MCGMDSRLIVALLFLVSLPIIGARMNSGVKTGRIFDRYMFRIGLNLMPRSMREKMLNYYGIDENFKQLTMWQYAVGLIVGALISFIVVKVLVYHALHMP